MKRSKIISIVLICVSSLCLVLSFIAGIQMIQDFDPNYPKSALQVSSDHGYRAYYGLIAGLSFLVGLDEVVISNRNYWTFVVIILFFSLTVYINISGWWLNFV